MIQPATGVALLVGVALALSGLIACEASGDGTAAPTPESAPSGQDADPARSPSDPLRGKTIVIDPGHNGLDWKHPEIINRKVDVITKKKACETTGTQTRSGYTEAAFAWDVSRRAAKVLEARGAKVKLTRKNNKGVGPCITERAAIGNRAKADAAISIHADGAPAGKKGFHLILPSKIGGPVDPVVDDSRKLGIAVRRAVHSKAGLPYSDYRGEKALDVRDDLGGLNLSTVPKVFIECGNMKNADEAAKMERPAFRKRLAEAIAEGMAAYLT